MRIPNGTAAVCALYPMLVDENQSLGNWEGRVRIWEISPGGVSQKNCMEKLLLPVCYQAQRQQTLAQKYTAVAILLPRLFCYAAHGE